MFSIPVHSSCCCIVVYGVCVRVYSNYKGSSLGLGSDSMLGGVTLLKRKSGTANMQVLIYIYVGLFVNYSLSVVCSLGALSCGMPCFVHEI